MSHSKKKNLTLSLIIGGSSESIVNKPKTPKHPNPKPQNIY